MQTPGKPAKKKRRSRIPVGLILLVLALAGGAAAVWYVPIPGLTVPTESAPAPGSSAGADTGSAVHEASPAAGDASAESVTREAMLAAKEQELAEREASLKERETRVNQLLKELTIQQSSGEMVRRLSGIYGSMAPAKAAELLTGMDRTTAVEILRMLEERQTADILAAMNSTVALELIREMARPLPATVAPGNG